jgi:hypothetical protein
VRTRSAEIRKRRAKHTLIALGVISCAGGAALAVAQNMGPSPSPAKPLSSTIGKPGQSLSIRITPLTRSIAPGDTTQFTLRIRNLPQRLVKLRVLDGVPQGATASLSKRSTRASRATLSVAAGGARSGGNRIRLLARSGHRRAIAALNLVIGSPKHVGNGLPQQVGNANFAIAGNLSTALEPGFGGSLDLALTNPGTTAIAVSGLQVALSSIVAPRASASYPCSSDDFSVAQFTGAYGFTIPASSTRTLSELGFPEAQLPQVAMPDRPLNQNGCKGASLQFDFTGTASGGPS